MLAPASNTSRVFAQGVYSTFIFSKIALTPSAPSFPPSSPAVLSVSSTSCIAFSRSSLMHLALYSKLPFLSMYATAYFLTSGSPVFCLRMLTSTRLAGSARMAWMTGKENLPSVRSSAKPFCAERRSDLRLRWSSRIWKRRPMVLTRGTQLLVKSGR